MVDEGNGVDVIEPTAVCEREQSIEQIKAIWRKRAIEEMECRRDASGTTDDLNSPCWRKCPAM